MEYPFLGTRFHYDHMFISNPINLNFIKLFQIGEICLEPKFEVPEHDQFCYEISCIFSGEGSFEHNGKRSAISAGDIVLTPKNGKHVITASDTREISYAYIGFDFNEDLPQAAGWSSDDLKVSNQIIKRDNSNLYAFFRRCMDEIYSFSEPNLLLIESYLVQIILLSSRNFAVDDKWRRHGTEQLGQLIYLIIKYVDRNIEKPIAVSDIAESLGYSTYYISHTFRLKMHMTLQDYIINRKTEKAKELISLRRFSLTEIAEKLGYINIQSFSRSFKNKTGMSPSEYLNHIK